MRHTPHSWKTCLMLGLLLSACTTGRTFSVDDTLSADLEDCERVAVVHRSDQGPQKEIHKYTCEDQTALRVYLVSQEHMTVIRTDGGRCYQAFWTERAVPTVSCALFQTLEAEVQQTLGSS